MCVLRTYSFDLSSFVFVAAGTGFGASIRIRNVTIDGLWSHKFETARLGRLAERRARTLLGLLRERRQGKPINHSIEMNWISTSETKARPQHIESETRESRHIRQTMADWLGGGENRAVRSQKRFVGSPDKPMISTRMRRKTPESDSPKIDQ